MNARLANIPIDDVEVRLTYGVRSDGRYAYVYVNLYDKTDKGQLRHADLGAELPLVLAVNTIRETLEKAGVVTAMFEPRGGARGN